MAKSTKRHTSSISVPTTLDARCNQLVYASRAVLVGDVHLDSEKCLAVRSDMMDSFPDFSSSDPRSDTEYVLKRSGRSGADGEYLLTIKPQVISVAAGKSISAATFADIHMKLWSSIANHFEIGSDTLSLFDINFTWDVETRGNPYLKSIIPALASSSLTFAQDLFVFQFDHTIRFQREADLTKAVFFLEIGSPHGYSEISTLTKANDRNRIRVKLGVGLNDNCLGLRQGGLAEIAAAHWESVVSELDADLYERLIEPVLASLEVGKPTTRTGTAKKPSKARHSSSKSVKKLSKRSRPSSTVRRRKKG